MRCVVVRAFGYAEDVDGSGLLRRRANELEGG
jgi:hypothetical protein